MKKELQPEIKVEAQGNEPEALSEKEKRRLAKIYLAIREPGTGFLAA